MNSMIYIAENAMLDVLDQLYVDSEKRKAMGKDVREAIQTLKQWNYRYDLNEKGAAIFLEWEFWLFSYFQETKIDNMDVRRGLQGNYLFENFMWN